MRGSVPETNPCGPYLPPSKLSEDVTEAKEVNVVSGFSELLLWAKHDARSFASTIPVTLSGNPTRQVAPFTEEES